MPGVTLDTITAAAGQAWAAAPDDRLRTVLERLVVHLHGFAREVALTHAEWEAAIAFLQGCGRISTETRNEFALLSDVLGFTSLVDLMNAAPGATVGSVLGPFYAENSPELEPGGDLVRDNAGTVVLVSGTVSNPQGEPLQGASIDLWQTDAKGFYATQDPAQPDENFRCQQRCDARGRYWFTTVLPGPYTIPMDGPVGDLFRAARRSEWRPAHYHFIVRAPGHRPIVTEVFFAHDEYIDDDAVFGVRADLVRRVADVTGPLPAPLERAPAKRVDFDFVLVPEAAKAYGPARNAATAAG